MLKKLTPLLLVAGLALSGRVAHAQVRQTSLTPDWCGTVAEQERYFAEHPSARAAQAAFYQQLAAMPALQARNTTGHVAPDITIPVVVHVIHSGGANNISDAQINSGIDLLNLDYQRLNADTAVISPLFWPSAANVGFRFRLAKIDPNGNCTTGITRHYAPALLNDDRSGAVQAVAYWNPAHYLNIWVVDAIGQTTSAGTVLGYVSGLPPNPTPGRDGFVTRGDNFGNIGTSNPSGAANRTPTHEIGHYFGLMHTWGNTNTPGTGDCTGTDYVNDTPVTDGTFSCNLGYATCGPVSNTQNYMNYSTCKAMFTNGQSTLMRNVLQGYRNQLTTPANLLATGTNNGYVAAACAPIAAFAPNTTTVCEGSSVTFRSYSYNLAAAGGTVRYAWTFPNGTATPATSTSIAPTVTYPVGGTYSVTLTVTNNVGTDSHTETQLITVTAPSLGEAAPLTESFEASGFPGIYPAPSQRNYATSSVSLAGTTSLSGWQRRASVPAADGVAYLQVPNLQYAAGTTATLISPNIDLNGITAPTLSFSKYYGTRSVSSNIVLQLAFSNDCGNTWVPGPTYTAAQLNQTGTSYQGGAAPNAPSDWATVQTPVPNAYLGSRTFQVRFQLRNSSGIQDNNFYFDKFQVTGVLGTHAAALARRDIAVYPNPLTNETAVHLTLAASAPVQIRLTDVVGREVLTLPAKTYPAGPQAIALPLAGRALPAGVYVVRIALEGQTFSSKLTVQ